jgi:hypothetical protein
LNHGTKCCQVIVSRMRYISSQTDRAVRFVGLSTALANAGYVSAFKISLNLQNAHACSARSNFHAYSINLEKKFRAQGHYMLGHYMLLLNLRF